MEMRVKVAVANDDSPGDMNQFARHSAEGNFFVFAVAQQVLVEITQDRVVADGAKGAHVQDAS
jgi:hypothetical protein